MLQAFDVVIPTVHKLTLLNSDLGDVDLENLLAHFPALRELDLESVMRFTDFGFLSPVHHSLKVCLHYALLLATRHAHGIRLTSSISSVLGVPETED